MSKKQKNCFFLDTNYLQIFWKNILWWKCTILREKFTEIVKYFKNHAIRGIEWK